MDNKFDAYEGFDPTQEKASPNACGDVYWDMVTQTWRKRTPSKPTNSASDAELTQAKADLANMTAKAEEKQAELTQTKADLASMTAKAEEKQAELNNANAELEKAKARIAELEKQLADQPTVCDVLKAHLEPVHRLNDETIYYAVKDADCDFIKGDVTSLGEESIHPLAEG